jgi:hypothetical protein
MVKVLDPIDRYILSNLLVIYLEFVLFFQDKLLMKIRIQENMYPIHDKMNLKSDKKMCKNISKFK